jgi:predicted metal-dependent phosphoesterase TrpH
VTAPGLVDLHVHSTASDGTRPPAEVVRAAAAAGLTGMALTDHDTVDGLAEAAAEARLQGLALLTGAELSANEPGSSIHLLAYGFDIEDPDLLEFMEVYRADRIRRAREMVHRFNGLGVSLGYDSVEREAGRAAPTRAHVARALVADSLIPTQQEVFGRYLSRGKPAFVEKRPTPPGLVIEIVHAAGGVVLLAHPGRTHGVADVRRWVADGLDGVEVMHPNNGPTVRQRMGDLVRELNLLRSGGSDWHGPATHRAELGSEGVPAAWLFEIADRCRAPFRTELEAGRE